ncbi:TadE/TadG family type IV pilus assembly protein [Saccharibacillus alkalitolerans]|uniref:Pilus assembly protein n=1 Tax=Saccharibacillus alkalitolerans TaxID=2705290 RepID=A0ABX0F5K5_9BACL|nr:TadE family protein [Saccharibacillus alkalitolerans]NGZ76007.1 pilus assembly protein [Saccharibacillus alkalitolerans]
MKEVHDKIRRAAGDRGSITVEASLVLPIFLLMFVFLAYIVQMTAFSTVLQTTASEAAKQVSTHLYPVQMAADRLSKVEPVAKGLEGFAKISFSELAAKYASSLPEPIGGWVEEAAAKGDIPLRSLKDEVSSAVLDPVIKPLLRPLIADGPLNMEKLHVIGITVPTTGESNRPYFGVELTYELPIKVPFTGKPISIRAKAEERAWIGDTGETEGTAEAGAGEEAGGSAVITSVPSPAYPGTRATVTAKVQPGQTATIKVVYKSGNSTARYLGQQTADASGNLSWTWLVGGNTTPGEWALVVETAGGTPAEASFEVRKRE